MGKKRSRSSKSSKGERRSIAKSVCKAVARDRDPFDKAMNVIRAWREGRNPWVTIPTTSKKEPFVRVKANAYYGDPKKVGQGIFQGAKDE